MPIKTACPRCEETYNLPDNLLGKKVKCRGCQKPFEVQPVAERKAAPRKVEEEEEALVVEAVEEDDEPRPRRSRARDDRDDRDDDRPSRRRSRDDDYEEDDRPRRRKRGGGMPIWGWVAIGVGALVLVVGIVVAVIAFSGSRVTAENFAKIKHGMTEAQVRDILGTPTEVNEPNLIGGGAVAIPGGKVLLYKSGDNLIRLHITNGVVTGTYARIRR